jgi:hypothetical protein
MQRYISFLASELQPQIDIVADAEIRMHIRKIAETVVAVRLLAQGDVQLQVCILCDILGVRL